MNTIYLDESGYSGSNYLDEQKPFFVVATIAEDPDEATEIKRRFFGSVKAEELKHSQLVRRHRSRKMVLDFLAYLATTPATSKVWLAEKVQAAWVKVVDYIIEPFLCAGGLNLYDQGGNLAMATMLRYSVPGFTTVPYAEALLGRSIAFIKTGASSERDALIELLERGKREHTAAEAQETLDYLLLPLRLVPPDELQPPRDAADMAFAAALQLMGWWRTDISAPIRLIHDATANMARRKMVWDAITDVSMPPHRSVAASGMVVTYPIAVEETVFEKSENCDGLQLADVLAGAIGCTSDVRLSGERGDYARAILDLIAGFALHALVPVQDITPQGMGTVGLDGNEHLDYLTEQHMAGRIPIRQRHERQKG